MSGAPITLEELDEIVRSRARARRMHPRHFSDVLSRFPRMTEAVCGWFEGALADEHRKWAAAAILEGRKEAVRPMLRALLTAALREPNASFNRAFVEPLAGVVTRSEAAAMLEEVAATDLDRERVPRVRYWFGLLSQT